MPTTTRPSKKSVISDYDAETAAERELVLRLASILWRLRRATSIETALFELAAEGRSESDHSPSGERLGRSAGDAEHNRPVLRAVPLPGTTEPSEPSADTNADIAACFLRLMDQPTFAFDRLGRYEHTLWRQARPLVFTLESLGQGTRRPCRFSFPFSSRRSERGKFIE